MRMILGLDAPTQGSVSDSTSLSPWRGFAVFCGYAVAALIAAAILLCRRDA
jgi:hypothetical protein